MTHRIYKAICTVAVVVFLCSLALIMELLYNYFSAVHLKQMKELYVKNITHFIKRK